MPISSSWVSGVERSIKYEEANSEDAALNKANSIITAINKEKEEKRKEIELEEAKRDECVEVEAYV
jgi:hypothetical protein